MEYIRPYPDTELSYKINANGKKSISKPQFTVKKLMSKYNIDEISYIMYEKLTGVRVFLRGGREGI